MADQQLALMKRGEATMYVPLAQVARWAAEGWVELSRPAVISAPVMSSTPAEVVVPPVKPAAKKAAGK